MGEKDEKDRRGEISQARWMVEADAKITMVVYVCQRWLEDTGAPEKVHPLHTK